VIWNKIGIAYRNAADQRGQKFTSTLQTESQYSGRWPGDAPARRKSYSGAIGQYNKALKLAPGSIHLRQLGTAQFTRKKYEEASCPTRRLALDLRFEHRNAYGTLLQERTVRKKRVFITWPGLTPMPETRAQSAHFMALKDSGAPETDGRAES
jgi:hypothetical protein